jgi:hypothetical protein
LRAYAFSNCIAKVTCAHCVLRNAADGYYKPDVYLYNALTLAIPLFAGWRRTLHRAPEV